MAKALTGKQVGAIFDALPGTRAELAKKLGVSPNTMTNWAKNGVSERGRLALVKLVEDHEREQRLEYAAMVDFDPGFDDWLERFYAQTGLEPGQPGYTNPTRLYQELHALFRASVFYLMEHTTEADYDAFALNLFDQFDLLARRQRADELEMAQEQGVEPTHSTTAFAITARGLLMGRVEFALSRCTSSLESAFLMGMLAYDGDLFYRLVDQTLEPGVELELLEDLRLDYALVTYGEAGGAAVGPVVVIIEDPYAPEFSRQAHALAHAALESAGLTLFKVSRRDITDALPATIAALRATIDQAEA